jgi:hypothetical protein
VDEDLADGDARLVQVMTRTARRILAGERAYDVCIGQSGALSELIGRAHHDGAAYILWAAIGDLLDAPGGPQSESACNAMAAAVATDWLSGDTESSESVSSYFGRWDPRNGPAWLAQRGRAVVAASDPEAT